MPALLTSTSTDPKLSVCPASQLHNSSICQIAHSYQTSNLASISEIAHTRNKEAAGNLIQGIHIPVHPHHPIALGQHSVGDGQALEGSLEGGWEICSPIPEFAPVTTQVHDAILSESYVRRLRSISKYISFLTRMISYNLWSLIVRSAPDTILI